MSEKETHRPPRRGPMGGHGPMGGPMAGERAKDFKGTMGKLLAYLGRYKFAMLGMLLFAAASAVFNIIGPKILGNSTGINGFWIMFAILLGGGLFGFIGMLLGVPVFVVIYAGLERLVDHGLKKRGLQTETAEYMDLDYIDDATMQPVRLPQEVPDESLKDSKDDSAK